MDYAIANGPDMKKLEDAVKERIRQGWHPQGGVAVTTYDTQAGRAERFYQAMIKGDHPGGDRIA